VGFPRPPGPPARQRRPDTATCWSGRGDGGRHLYFLRPAGPLTSTRLPRGVDLKVHGYCIVPPSVHPATGMPYRWEDHPVAPLPYHLRELLRPLPVSRIVPAVRHGDGKGLVAWLGEQTSNVNDALFWAACRAHEDGVLDALADELVAAAETAARTAGTWTAAGKRQSRRTVQSARKAAVA
jgi:Bifunctional DNA primase/polymerase, N-terminal